MENYTESIDFYSWHCVGHVCCNRNTSHAAGSGGRYKKNVGSRSHKSNEQLFKL